MNIPVCACVFEKASHSLATASCLVLVTVFLRACCVPKCMCLILFTQENIASDHRINPIPDHKIAQEKHDNNQLRS